MSDRANIECTIDIGLIGCKKTFTMVAHRSDIDDEATRQAVLDDLQEQALEHALQNHIEVTVKFPKEWENE